MVEPYYSDGRITVYRGDCREVLPCLPRVDVVMTDPPYAIKSGIVADRPTKWQRRAGLTVETWDDATDPDTVLGLLKKAGKVVVWGGNYYALPPSRCWLAWHKPDAPPSMANVEFAWTSLDRNSRQLSHSISATNAERVGHPTQKPVRVMRWAVEQCGLTSGSVILDPFMGSGTTGVAAVLEGHRFIGIERDEHWCTVAVARMRRAVGEAVDVPRIGKRQIATPLFEQAQETLQEVV